jgi:TRAP-type C4-dicarboxylate transport system permease small subunit
MLDLLYNSLSGLRRRLAALVNAVLGLALCVVLTVVGILVVLDQIDSGVRETTVMAPHSFWLTLALPLGMALMSFQFLDQAVRAVTNRID